MRILPRRPSVLCPAAITHQRIGNHEIQNQVDQRRGEQDHERQIRLMKTPTSRNWRPGPTPPARHPTAAENLCERTSRLLGQTRQRFNRSPSIASGGIGNALPATRRRRIPSRRSANSTRLGLVAMRTANVTFMAPRRMAKLVCESNNHNGKVAWADRSCEVSSPMNTPITAT